MNLTTALQTLADANLDAVKTKVEDYWQQLLWQAVKQQLHATCFLMYKEAERVLDGNLITLNDEIPLQKHYDLLYSKSYDHCQCVEFWYSIPPAERAYKFYCLGAPSWCSSCGTQINSVVFAKEGKLVKNACPACGVTREDTRLARDDWWEALAHGTGEILAGLDRSTATVLSQLIQRLAHFYVRGRILVGPDTDDGRNAMTRQLYNLLFEQFGEHQRSTCYDAARWAVWKEHIETISGLQLEDVASTLRNALLPALIQSCGDPAVVEQVKAVLDEELDYGAKMRKLRRLAPHTRASDAEPEPRAQAVRVVDEDDEFLIIKINGNLDGIRSHLDIVKDVDVHACLPEGIDGWLADIFTEEA